MLNRGTVVYIQRDDGRILERRLINDFGALITVCTEREFAKRNPHSTAFPREALRMSLDPE